MEMTSTKIIDLFIVHQYHTTMFELAYQWFSHEIGQLLIIILVPMSIHCIKSHWVCVNSWSDRHPGILILPFTWKNWKFQKENQMVI